jgi:hypothetical protein
MENRTGSSFFLKHGDDQQNACKARDDGYIRVQITGKRWLSMSRVDRLPFFGRLSWGGDEYHLHVWRIAEMRELLAEHFVIQKERFVPTRLFPIRCCFLAVNQGTPAFRFDGCRAAP